MIGIRLAQCVGHRVIFGEQTGELAHAGNDGFKNALLRIKRRLLRDIAHTDTRLTPDAAIVERPRAGQCTQQRRLAGTVAADQGDTFAGIKLKICVVKKRHMAESE